MKIASVFLCALFVSARALPINDDQPPSDDEANAAPASPPPSNVGRIPATMTLPSNATAIRAEITDTFSCEGKIYGYYADVDNDCQIFHICLPVTYADGKENMFRWSFVCPDETIFSQELFTCIRPADWSSDCSDSGKFVELNRQFGSAGDSSAAFEENTSDEQQSSASDSVQNDEIAPVQAAPQEADIRLIESIRPEASQVKVIADIRPDELKIPIASLEPEAQEAKIWVKAFEQPQAEPAAPISASASDEHLPVYDADTSETQSFGLFQVADINANESAEELLPAVRVDTTETPETPASIAEVAEAVLPVAEEVAEDVAAEAAIATATEIGAGVEEAESTELWNQYTLSLYDGGSTIDDNVEVNAISEDVISTTPITSAR